MHTLLRSYLAMGLHFAGDQGYVTPHLRILRSVVGIHQDVSAREVLRFIRDGVLAQERLEGSELGIAERELLDVIARSNRANEQRGRSRQATSPSS